MTSHRLDLPECPPAGATLVLVPMEPQPIQPDPEEGSIFWNGEWGSPVGLSGQGPYSPGDEVTVDMGPSSEPIGGHFSADGMPGELLDCCSADGNGVVTCSASVIWSRTVVSVEAVVINKSRRGCVDWIGNNPPKSWIPVSPWFCDDWEKRHPGKPWAWAIEVQ